MTEHNLDINIDDVKLVFEGCVTCASYTAAAAYVFYPEEMKLTNRTTDFKALQASYDAGYVQAQRELDDWQRWLS